MSPRQWSTRGVSPLSGRRRRTSSWRRRDFPAPAAAVTRTARGPAPSVQAAKLDSSIASSRSRPTHEVGRPSNGRVGSTEQPLVLHDQERAGPTDVEARGDQGRGDVVDVDAAARRSRAHDPHASIDGLAHREATAGHRAPGREGDARVGQGLGDLPAEAREQRRLVGGAQALGGEGDGGAVGERLDPDAEPRHRRAERVDVAAGRLVRRVRRRIRVRRHQDEDGHHPLLARSERGGPGAHHAGGGGRHLPEVGDPLPELRAVAGATLGILRHHAVHEDVERLRDVANQLPDPRRLFEEDLGEHRHHVRTAEEATPGDALEKDAPEGEDVDARRDHAVAARLLRGHEAGRADEDARESERAGGDRGARDAQVDHLDVVDPAAGQKQVRGFEVAVHDAAPVEVRERVGDVARESSASLHRGVDRWRGASAGPRLRATA